MLAEAIEDFCLLEVVAGRVVYPNIISNAATRLR
jgi:hypothetical protein